MPVFLPVSFFERIWGAVSGWRMGLEVCRWHDFLQMRECVSACHFGLKIDEREARRWVVERGCPRKWLMEMGIEGTIYLQKL